MSGPELATVESPFIDQLIGMGWKLVTGNLDEPSATGRETFREVLIKPDLRKAIERINLRDGKPWLDDARISQVVSVLERISASKLIEANQQATELLLKGIAVEGLPDWDQGRSRTVHYIDWDHPENAENNTFTVMNQFRVDCPGGMAKGFIVPDLVLFVNGIPLVVVECKSPGVAEPLPSAVGSPSMAAASSCNDRWRASGTEIVSLKVVQHDRRMEKLVLGVNLGLAAIYFGLVFWARRNPRVAAAIAPILLVAVLVTDVALAPKTLTLTPIKSMFLAPVVLLGLFGAPLVKAITAAQRKRAQG